MHQHWLEQEEAQPTPRMRQRLRRATAEVTSDEAATLKGMSLTCLIAPRYTCVE